MITLAIFHPSKFVNDSFELFCLKHESELCLLKIDNYSKYLDSALEYIFDLIVISSNNFLNKQNEAFINQIKDKGIKMIVLGQYDDDGSISYFFSRGANCYLKENEGFDMIYEAISILNKSGLFSPYSINHNPLKRPNVNYVLTDKELKIFDCFRKEMTNQEVSKLLGIHIKTVEFHRKNLIEKCGAKNLIGVFDYLISNGKIPVIA